MENCKKMLFLLSIFFQLSCQSNNKATLPIKEFFIPQGYGGMILFEASYKGNSENIISFNTIIEKKLSGQVVTMSRDAIIGIISFRNGAVWGEELSTYADGSLKKYAFRNSARNVAFYRKYDSLHHLIGEHGTPCVGHFAREYSNGDSLRSDILFADRVFEDMQIELSTDGISYKRIDTYNDDEYAPYKVYRYKSSLGDRRNAKLYIRMSCIDSNIKKRVIFNEIVPLIAVDTVRKK
ncbi:hypothetical protein [Chitinophaga filiformis]|uniref:Uncharacterized protein n=1 Tax=Chitinophaga filiformis TaxID=104663 RepID=A0ABY4HVG0_CHIFI|nr:hypothetical protein [Chitinophaga filiformis]UPK67453.1 hypothetical protein MYF79_21145 [Chitinophaga filiformis]